MWEVCQKEILWRPTGSFHSLCINVTSCFSSVLTLNKELWTFYLSNIFLLWFFNLMYTALTWSCVGWLSCAVHELYLKQTKIEISCEKHSIHDEFIIQVFRIHRTNIPFSQVVLKTIIGIQVEFLFEKKKLSTYNYHFNKGFCFCAPFLLLLKTQEPKVRGQPDAADPWKGVGSNLQS